MAYLILSTGGYEWDRRELTGPIVLGRSPDCDISVHDILLSRRHCRIAPSSDGWLLIDLASRNGTQVGTQTVEQCRLKQGDVIRLGKTKLTFRSEKFVRPTLKVPRPALPPAITREQLLNETVSGMAVVTSESANHPRRIYRPTPKPRPMDPISFTSDNLYTMLDEIASSSWDSIYAVNAQPLRRGRTLPSPKVAGRSPMVSLSLQATLVACPPKRSPRWTRGRVGRILSRVRALIL